jgi:protein-S-isoprenylcysteine O-methyltransferase Ste14
MDVFTNRCRCQPDTRSFGVARITELCKEDDRETERMENLNMDLPPNQDRPNVRIPPPLIFFALLGIAGVLESGAGLNYPRGPLVIRCAIALVVFIFSGYLALHAFVVLKKHGTFIDPNKPTTQIVEDGPFRFSRNPMYLSLVLVLFGLSVLFLSIWFLFSAAVLWLVFDRIAVAPEEVYLEQKFGDRYTEYKSRVRRWI